jgi:enamine deaminase RidA (YjgF/YER057c/UK114 family)
MYSVGQNYTNVCSLSSASSFQASSGSSNSTSSGGGTIERKVFPGPEGSPFSCAVKLGDVFYLSGQVSFYQFI